MDIGAMGVITCSGSRSACAPLARRAYWLTHRLATPGRFFDPSLVRSRVEGSWDGVDMKHCEPFVHRVPALAAASRVCAF